MFFPNFLLNWNHTSIGANTYLDKLLVLIGCNVNETIRFQFFWEVYETKGFINPKKCSKNCSKGSIKPKILVDPFWDLEWR
jgi:hypothetical protein